MPQGKRVKKYPLVKLGIKIDEITEGIMEKLANDISTYLHEFLENKISKADDYNVIVTFEKNDTLNVVIEVEVLSHQQLDILTVAGIDEAIDRAFDEVRNKLMVFKGG